LFIVKGHHIQSITMLLRAVLGATEFAFVANRNQVALLPRPISTCLSCVPVECAGRDLLTRN